MANCQKPQCNKCAIDLLLVRPMYQKKKIQPDSSKHSFPSLVITDNPFTAHAIPSWSRGPSLYLNNVSPFRKPAESNISAGKYNYRSTKYRNKLISLVVFQDIWTLLPVSVYIYITYIVLALYLRHASGLYIYKLQGKNAVQKRWLEVLYKLIWTIYVSILVVFYHEGYWSTAICIW